MICVLNNYKPGSYHQQCPPSLWLLELMCWCWSEHPYHRPDIKEVLTALEKRVTSQLVSAFPISSEDAGIHAVAAYTRFSLKGRSFTSSLSGEKQPSLSAPGYLSPFSLTKKSSTKSPSLDIWFASKDRLKHIECQTNGQMIEVGQNASI